MLKRKSIITILLVFLAVALFLFVPPLIVWANGGAFEVQVQELRFSILLLILTPFLIWLSSKIKNNWLFVFLAIVIIAVAGFLMNIIFPN
ncbi:hypothetical protein [Maribellus mangrovi]|uniref:hypothetical protein n=1 Tax=Maribellus mangrovi TaxID=3133146 RepID=UPI0030EC78A6